MNTQQYWQDLYAYHANCLPQSKVLKYKLAGAFSESAARERGSTLIPACMDMGDLRPEELPEILLVAIGFTVLAIQTTEQN
jgi:hypothetical protein